MFPFDDPKRTMVQNHWAIVPATIADLTADQQELTLGLIRQVCTPAGFARLTRQRDDDAGGWKHDHLAVFGSPADPRGFEWVVTGRHLTLRGSSSGKVGGGPLFWGHSLTGSANLWRDQAEAAGELSRTLDDEQRRRAVAAITHDINAAGLDLATVRPDQRAAARRLLASLVGSFRAFEVGSIPAYLDESSRLEGLCWQGFPTSDGGANNTPGVWRLIGPGFRWSFHDTPHVHSWFDLA